MFELLSIGPFDDAVSLLVSTTPPVTICHAIFATNIFGIYGYLVTPTLTLPIILVVVKNVSFNVIFIIWGAYQDHGEMSSRQCVLGLLAVHSGLLWHGFTSPAISLVNLTSNCTSLRALC